jgi:glycosyltransferase involved in cell wall biosynthesis
MVNRGQGAALQTGIGFALRQGAEVVVTFDADGQHDMEDIPALVAPVLSGECDVALGSRFLHPGTEVPLIRRLVLKSGILFTRVVSRVRISDTHNGFRAFSRRAASELRIALDRMAHASEIIDQIRENHWRYREVPVRILYTDYAMTKGQSSWNALRIASQFLFRKITR